MHSLCISTSLTSIELAAWVQALGTMSAVIGALIVAMWQSNKHYKNSQKLILFEKESEKSELSKSIFEISKNSLKTLDYYIKLIPDRETLHNIAEGFNPLIFSHLKSTNESLNSIPLYKLPYKILTLTSMVISINRQFLELYESSFINYRTMNSLDFEDFFRISKEMRDSLQKTCDDIQSELIDLALKSNT